METDRRSVPKPRARPRPRVKLRVNRHGQPRTSPYHLGPRFLTDKDSGPFNEVIKLLDTEAVSFPA